MLEAAWYCCAAVYGTHHLHCCSPHTQSCCPVSSTGWPAPCLWRGRCSWSWLDALHCVSHWGEVGHLEGSSGPSWSSSKPGPLHHHPHCDSSEDGRHHVLDMCPLHSGTLRPQGSWWHISLNPTATPVSWSLADSRQAQACSAPDVLPLQHTYWTVHS